MFIGGARVVCTLKTKRGPTGKKSGNKKKQILGGRGHCAIPRKKTPFIQTKHKTFRARGFLVRSFFSYRFCSVNLGVPVTTT